MQSKKDAAFWTEKRIERERKHLEIFLTFHEMIANGAMVMPAMEDLSARFGLGIVTISNIRKAMPAKIADVVTRHPKLKDRAFKWIMRERSAVPA